MFEGCCSVWSMDVTNTSQASVAYKASGVQYVVIRLDL